MTSKDIAQAVSCARLYVSGPPEKSAQAREVLLTALSLLPETDVQRGAAAIQVEWGGETRQWDNNHSAFWIRYGISTASQWKQMSLEVQQELLNK